jgi:hypothetical protein
MKPALAHEPTRPVRPCPLLESFRYQLPDGCDKFAALFAVDKMLQFLF